MSRRVTEPGGRGACAGRRRPLANPRGRLAREDAANPAMLVKDVGVDACGYRPWSFEELSDYMAPRVEAFHRRKATFRDGKDDGANL